MLNKPVTVKATATRIVEKGDMFPFLFIRKKSKFTVQSPVESRNYENTDKSHTMKADVATENSATTITSSKNYFTQDMVGMHLRLRKVAVGSSSEDAIGWITITSVDSGTVAHGLVESKLFEANLSTYAWRLSEFSESRGYPKKVALFKGRLCFASTEKMPNTIWLSKSDSYHNFGPTNMNDNEVEDQKDTEPEFCRTAVRNKIRKKGV